MAEPNKPHQGNPSGEKSLKVQNEPLCTIVTLLKNCARGSKWKNSVVGEEDRRNWHATPHTLLGSEIPREMLYTPLSNPPYNQNPDC